MADTTDNAPLIADVNRWFGVDEPGSLRDQMRTAIVTALTDADTRLASLTKERDDLRLTEAVLRGEIRRSEHAIATVEEMVAAAKTEVPGWVDEALCDALSAAQAGQFDGMTVEEHLTYLIERVRHPQTGQDGERG